MSVNNALDIVLLFSQLYLAAFFLRSAYRKIANFETVSDEFRRWGFPFPRQVTVFLSMLWIVCAPLLLVPAVASGAAAVLLAFMLAAFLTLVIHKEWRRLREPAVPIALLTVVAIGNGSRFAFGGGWFSM